jgi:hypothetical protein
MQSMRTLSLVAIVAVVALVLVGLELSPSEGSPVRVDGSTLELRLDEFRVSPQDVRMHPGRIRIQATNTGVLTHSLRVQQIVNGSPVVLDTTSIARPGQSVSTSVRLRRGTYQLADAVGNHGELGQTGTLVVG